MERDYNRQNIAIGTHKYPFAFLGLGFWGFVGGKTLICVCVAHKNPVLIKFPHAYTCPMAGFLGYQPKEQLLALAL